MHVVYFQQLAFQPVDKDGVATGKEEIVKRGDPVPSYVPPFVINSLTNAGMIVEVGDTDPGLVPIEEIPVAPPGPDNPPGPNGPALPDLGTGAGDVVSPVPVEKPKPTDSRATWEQYGSAIGLDQLQLEALPNKAAVIEAVDAREAELSNS